MAGELLTGASRGPGGRLVRLAAVTTRSLPALKSYLEGEALLRAGHADSAMDAFGRATQADTLFALAYYRQAVAADWAAKFDDARTFASRAVRHGVRLSPSDRRLLHALETFHRGDAIGAEREYRQVLRDDPENVEAWYQLGEVLFHLGPAHGRAMTEAREAFERALHYDPQYGDALFHLLDVTGRERRWAAYDSLLGHASGESSILLRRRAVRAVAVGDAAERERVMQELALASDGTVVVAAGQVAAFTLDFPAAARILRFLVEPTRTPVMQALGHLSLARLEAGRGHAAASRVQLHALAALEPAWALVNHALLAVAPMSTAPRTELAAVRDSLRGWDADHAAPLTGPAIATVENGVQPLLRHFLLGVLDARLGDSVEARRAEAALRAAPMTPASGTLPLDLAEGVAAEIARAAGRNDVALAALERVRSEVPLERLANSAFYGDVHGRMLRAGLLLDAGRLTEARQWYGSVGEGRYDAAYIAPAQLGLARAAERLGDTAAARTAYTRFVGLMRDCDPELRPQVEEARQRLAALGGAAAD